MIRNEVRIRELVIDVPTWSPQRDGNGEQITYIDITAVDQASKTIRKPQRIRTTDAPSRARQLVRANDVLVSTVRPNLNAVAIVPREFDGATASTGFCVLRPIAEAIDSSYLLHWVKSPNFVGEMTRLATGASYPAVTDAIVLDSKIPLPALPQQKRIAAILDAAEALREKRRQASALSEDLRSSMFADMFGVNDEVFHRWPMAALGSLLSFLTSGSRGWARHYSDSGDLFLRIENVGRDRLLLDSATYVRPPKTAEARRTLTRPNDVLLTITADLGRTAVIPKGVGTAYINQHLAILRTEAIDPRFLSAFIASPAGQKQVLGKNRQAVKAGLNFDDIRSLIIPVPPPDLQQHYRRFANALDRQSIINVAAMAKAKHLTQSLQLRAFRGEL